MLNDYEVEHEDVVMKLYETAIDFYSSGGGNWSKVTDGYQRDLDNFKYGH